MIRRFSARLQTLLVLVGLVLVFGIASPHFLTTDNLLNVMQQSAINAILGIGLTFVIISAGSTLGGLDPGAVRSVVADLLVAGHSGVLAVGAGSWWARVRYAERPDHHPRPHPPIHRHTRA